MLKGASEMSKVLVQQSVIYSCSHVPTGCFVLAAWFKYQKHTPKVSPTFLEQLPGAVAYVTTL